ARVDGTQRHRGRMGPQPAAGAARRRVAGAAVLLRPKRLHRDVSLRSGLGARLRGVGRIDPAGVRHRQAGGCRRTARAGLRRAVRRADGARAGGGHQPARSRRRRARRRLVEHRSALHVGAKLVAALRVLGPHSHAARPGGPRRFERRARGRLVVGGVSVNLLTEAVRGTGAGTGDGSRYGGREPVQGTGADPTNWSVQWTSISVDTRRTGWYSFGAPSQWYDL